MSKAKGSKGTGRKSKPAGKGSAKKARPKRKRQSNRGAVKRAREQVAGLIDPSIHIVVDDPLRIRILAVAIQRPYAPSEFARDVGIPTNSAAYHFKKLRDNGFLELVYIEPVRGSTKHYYRATKSGYISEADWGEVADALRPGVAGAILQDFNGRVTQAIETKTLFERDDAWLYWVPADLDEIAWPEQVEFIKWFVDASKNLVVETANRRANDESEGSFHATVAVAAFPSPTHEQLKQHRASKGKKVKIPKKPKRKVAKKTRGSAAKPKARPKPKGGDKA